MGAPQNREAGTPTKEGKGTEEDYDRPPWVMLLPVAALLLLSLAAGLWPGLKQEAQKAAARVEDRHAYAAAVLGMTDASPRVEVEKESQVSGVWSGLGVAGCALLLAGLALFRHRLPDVVRTGFNCTLGPLLSGLRVLHSGNVAHYVTWVVVGVAAVGALFSLLFHGQ